MDILGLGFATLVILLFVLAFIWTISRQKEASKSALNQAVELGFEPLEEGEQTLLERLVELHEKFGHQEIEIRNLYRRRGPDYQLYLFDLWDVSGDSVDRIQENGIAVVSPLLILPRFSVFPKLEGDGLLPSFVNLVFNAVISRKMSVINFENYPAFDDRYYVAGEDENAIRVFLSDHVQRRLSRDPFWHIEAGGDLFTFAKFDLASIGKVRVEDDLKERVREAMIIFGLFEDG
jgi:hypothetical protein